MSNFFGSCERAKMIAGYTGCYYEITCTDQEDDVEKTKEIQEVVTKTTGHLYHHDTKFEDIRIYNGDKSGTYFQYHRFILAQKSIFFRDLFENTLDYDDKDKIYTVTLPFFENIRILDIVILTSMYWTKLNFDNIYANSITHYRLTFKDQCDFYVYVNSLNLEDGSIRFELAKKLIHAWINAISRTTNFKNNLMPISIQHLVFIIQENNIESYFTKEWLTLARKKKYYNGITEEDVLLLNKVYKTTNSSFIYDYMEFFFPVITKELLETITLVKSKAEIYQKLLKNSASLDFVFAYSIWKESEPYFKMVMYSEQPFLINTSRCFMYSGQAIITPDDTIDEIQFIVRIYRSKSDTVEQDIDKYIANGNTFTHLFVDTPASTIYLVCVSGQRYIMNSVYLIFNQNESQVFNNY